MNATQGAGKDTTSAASVAVAVATATTTPTIRANTRNTYERTPWVFRQNMCRFLLFLFQPPPSLCNGGNSGARDKVR